MSEIKVSKLGQICLAQFEGKVIPALESCPSELLLKPHTLGEVMIITKSVPLPKAEERLWKRSQ